MELFKTDFKCNFCNKLVDASRDYIKIVFIKKGKEGKKKFRFCSISCMEKWLISKDTNPVDIDVNSLEEGIIQEEEKESKKKEEEKKVEKEDGKKISEEIEGKSYKLNGNTYSNNLNYVDEEKNKNNKEQEKILIENLDPSIKKLKEIENVKEYPYVEEYTVKQKLKYHFAPKTFLEKMKDRLKIMGIIRDYED